MAERTAAFGSESLNPDALAARLRGGVDLDFDSNAVFSVPRWDGVVRRLRDLRIKSVIGGRLHISSLVYQERLQQYRRDRGSTYRESTIREGLEGRDIVVRQVDLTAADRIAEAICEWFPDKHEWSKARVLRMLSLTGMHSATPPKDVSATTDWLIAAQAHANRAILITDDTGPEFDGCERASLGTLEAALDLLEGQT